MTLRNADHNALDHHSHDTDPQQSTLRVAEHLHRTADDLHLVDLNHHAATAHRILLDAAEHLPEVPLSLRRHHQAWTLDLSVTTPDADDTWGDWRNNPSDAHHPDDRRPRSPQVPPSNTSATAPLGSVSYRVATGDSDASDPEESFSIAAYEPGDTEIEEMKAAADDPNRTRCVTELGSSHVVSIRTELDNPTKILYNNFIDEMFNQLAKPYTTTNNEPIYIKASRGTVTNIATSPKLGC